MGGDSLAVIFVVFVLTQSLYFVVNLAVVGLLYARRVNYVPEEDPSELRPVHVLMPVRNERPELLQETIVDLYAQDYPADKIHVYLIYETDDELAGEYFADLAISARDRGWDIVPHGVDRELLSIFLEAAGQLHPGVAAPRTKAAALIYGFSTLTFGPDDVVTVYDADTELPADTFRLAIRGLEEYDVVQAKQTVRNVDDGWLPTLEAMGIAGWSHIIYPRTTQGPYQLLGKGYFLTGAVLYDLGGWDADELTEDMALGVAAHTNGYSLGVIDRYVRDLCPSAPSVWFRQKTRWVSGPYAHLLSDRFTNLDRARFWTFTVGNQLVSLTNLFGVPVGVFVFWYSVFGPGATLSPALTALVGFNLVCWLYYSLHTYRAVSRAMSFETRRQKVRFYLLSNPLTQLLYATLWAVPILGAWLQLGRRESLQFDVTPK